MENTEIAKKQYRTRFSKFPYIFWAFGKEKNFDVKNGKLQIENNENTFEFRRLSKGKFYAMKYIVPLMVFAVIFRSYDFYFSDIFRLLAHIFSIFLVMILLLSKGIARSILLIVGMALVVGICFLILDMPPMISFVVKYVSFYYVFLMMFIDKDYNAYSLIDEGRVVSNFVIHKKIDDLSEK